MPHTTRGVVSVGGSARSQLGEPTPGRQPWPEKTSWHNCDRLRPTGDDAIPSPKPARLAATRPASPMNPRLAAEKLSQVITRQIGLRWGERVPFDHRAGDILVRFGAEADRDWVDRYRYPA